MQELITRENAMIDYETLPDEPMPYWVQKDLDNIVAEGEGRATMPYIAAEMPNEAYHAHKALSRSALWTFKKLPQKYWYEYLSGKYERPKDTDAMTIGTAVHTLVLEPHLFDEQYFRFPKVNRTTKAGKALYAEALEEAAGRILLNAVEYQQCLDMRDSIMANPMIKTMIQEAENPLVEHSMFWTDKETGLQLKCRPDLLSGPLAIDLKTTLDASFRGFQGSAFKFGYFMQAAMVRMGCVALGLPCENFVFIAVEKSAPHSVGVYVIDPAAWDAAEMQLRTILHDYKKCLDSNVWPGYQIQSLTMPGYADYETSNYEIEAEE